MSKVALKYVKILPQLMNGILYNLKSKYKLDVSVEETGEYDNKVKFVSFNHRQSNHL